MKLRCFVIFISFILLINGAAIYTLLGNQDNVADIDVAQVNDLLYESSNNWQQIVDKNGEIIDNQYSFDYAIIDIEEKLLVTTNQSNASTIVAGTKSRSTIRDISVDGELVGRLIISNDINSIVAQKQKNIAVMFAVSSALMIVATIAYYMYLRNKVVKPFEKMKTFATNVAQGNLDVPLEMDEDNIFGVFTESFDIMRDELATARERERQANESKQELVAQLSHDIKTPVASIIAMTEVLQVTNQNEKQQAKLVSINEKANQIDKLVTDLFESTLEELEQLHVEVADFSSTEIAEWIQSSDYKKMIEAVEIPDCMVSADDLRLRQVFDNIIYNSYKYADTKICVEAGLKEEKLEIRIFDFGGGVSEDELPLIMKKYKRGSNAAGHKGSGLGLYIASQLLLKMGGEMTCSNTKEGFCVTILLPLS